jgi:hypothetical protein|tara:strand:- start:338 stop:688 length:351 start_codon:yes stop_codon:yes gene_type:complete
MGNSSSSAEVIHQEPTDRKHGPTEGNEGENQLQHLMRALGMIGTPATDGASHFSAFARAKSVQPASVSITGGATLHLHFRQLPALVHHKIDFTQRQIQNRIDRLLPLGSSGSAVVR